MELLHFWADWLALICLHLGSLIFYRFDCICRRVVVDLVYGFGTFLVGSGHGLLSVCFVGQGSGMQNPKFIQWSRPLSLHIKWWRGLLRYMTVPQEHQITTPKTLSCSSLTRTWMDVLHHLLQREESRRKLMKTCWPVVAFLLISNFNLLRQVESKWNTIRLLRTAKERHGILPSLILLLFFPSNFPWQSSTTVPRAFNGFWLVSWWFTCYFLTSLLGMALGRVSFIPFPFPNM